MASEHQVYNRRELEKYIGISQAVRAGDFLFISGCISWDLEGNILHPNDPVAQINAIYAEIDATLKAHGLGARHIVRETVYCRDMKALTEEARAARMAYYKDTALPASTWVEVSSIGYPETLFEIEITAYSGK